MQFGSTPTDLDDVIEAAQATGSDTQMAPEGLNRLLDDPATEGLVVLGTDSDLASVVDAMLKAGRDLPIALIPRRKSDLLRMFGLKRIDILDRLQSGGPYRSDLGRISIGDGSRSFVSHVTATARGGLGRLRRSTAVDLGTARRSHRLDAWWVVVANSQHVGGRSIAPRAAIVDGQLDVQVFGGSIAVRPHLMQLAKRGLHLRHRAVWRRSVDACSVAIPDGWRVKVDGVPAGSGPFEVAAEQGAFSLWV